MSLTYELLDAHFDTLQIASSFEGEPDWDAHFRYLRDLQRRAREVIAESTADPLRNVRTGLAERTRESR